MNRDRLDDGAGAVGWALLLSMLLLGGVAIWLMTSLPGWGT